MKGDICMTTHEKNNPLLKFWSFKVYYGLCWLKFFISYFKWRITNWSTIQCTYNGGYMLDKLCAFYNSYYQLSARYCTKHFTYTTVILVLKNNRKEFARWVIFTTFYRMNLVSCGKNISDKMGKSCICNFLNHSCAVVCFTRKCNQITIFTYHGAPSIVPDPAYCLVPKS